MIELHGTLLCQTDAEVDAVRVHLSEHIQLTRAEPGCLRFDVEQSVDPMVWTVFEQFESRAAFDAHQARTAASRWAVATAGIERRYEIREL